MLNPKVLSAKTTQRYDWREAKVRKEREIRMRLSPRLNAHLCSEQATSWLAAIKP
jgi:hypothetical protein